MVASSWVPEQSQLQQLVKYLQESISARDRNTQVQAELMLKQAKSSPDFDNYLCYLLCSINTSQVAQDEQTRLHLARSAAGVMLKNDIKAGFKKMSSTTQSYITSNIFDGLHNTNAQIRNYTGLAIAELVRQRTIGGWPDAIQRLLATALNSDGKTTSEAQEGASAAIKSICEDNQEAFTKSDQSANGSLQYLIKHLLDLLQSPNAKVRANAVSSLSVFMAEKSNVVAQNLNQMLERLFSLAHDPSSDVRSCLCESIVQVAKTSPAVLIPYMDGLTDFMLSQQKDPDDDDNLAVHAAEFWLFVADEPQTCNLLTPHLSKIIPVLLENMIYPEDDVIRLEAEADDDAEREDRRQDIKPQFASSKAARTGASAGDNSNDKAAAQLEHEDGELSEGEIDEDEEGDDPEEQWTLRKCSAASLDTLAGGFPEAVFENTLPYLRENLSHKDWQNREAAVLAIGAIADGCMDVLVPHLPELVPFLIDRLGDKQAIVRQISCWSLGRYSAWAAHLDDAGKNQYFVPMMDGILQRMLDNNKLVQEAASSAFANLEEKANSVLANPAYCQVIVTQFAKCFDKYKEKNIFILYDCIQTLAEHVTGNPECIEYIHLLMPPLLKRWENVKDIDTEMFPLLECLSYIASSMGSGFAPYAVPLFERCLRIIYDNLELTIATVDDPDFDGPVPDFLITSLDLLSAIIQALGENVSTLIAGSNGRNLKMFELLPLCLENSDNDVRQSAYALLGDCAIHAWSDLFQHLTTVMPILVRHLGNASNPDTDLTHAVINNACWSSGEIAMRAKPSTMDQYAEPLMQSFYSILGDSELPSSVHDNAALALGRLGHSCAAKMAPHLATIGPPFFKRISTIVWEDEKCHAMKGMASVVLKNPQASEGFIYEFLGEIGSGAYAYLCQKSPRFMEADGPSEDFQKILESYSTMVPNFQYLFTHLPAEHLSAMREVFRF